MQPSRMGNNLNYLTQPSTESVYDDGTIENSPILQFAYGAASMQGWRKKQEDKFTCLASLCKNFSFYGVYDGHGGSEIAEYLQENLHLEIKHFLELVDDVEIALYLGFLSGDSTLRVPEIIAELNAKLDLENSGTSMEKRKKLIHHAKLLKELKKKRVNETQDAVDATKPNGVNLSAAGSTKESNADDQDATGSTQDPTAATEDPTAATVDPTAATEDSTAATEDSTAATEDSTAATEDSTAATEDSTAATEDSTAATEDSTAATEDSTAATEDSTAATEDSTAATEDSTAATEDPTAATEDPTASAQVPTGSTHDSSAGGPTQDSPAGGPTQDSSAGGPTQDSSAGEPTQDSSAGGPTQDSCSAESTRKPGAAGSAESSSVAHSTQDSDFTKSSEEMDAAGPSQECDSTTEEEEVEMDDESTEEEVMDVVMGEVEKDEIDEPLEYLLNQDLESTDPEDEDFSYDEDTESEGSDEGVKNTGSGLKLTTEEFVNLQPGDLSGSTATVVLLNESTMYVANVGDSRCVLSRKGEAVDMSIDHKPTDAEEEERIVLNGGSVRMGRVNESIDMSRAFGDFKLKGSSLIPSEQCVTAEPTIKSIPIDMDDEFLVIASDGIWNAMSSQEVVDYINMRLKQEDCDLRDICNELFQMILSPNLENDGTGCDNMSCIIIKFIQRGVRCPGRTIGPLHYDGRLTVGINKSQNVTLLYNS